MPGTFKAWLCTFKSQRFTEYKYSGTNYDAPPEGRAHWMKWWNQDDPNDSDPRTRINIWADVYNRKIRQFAHYRHVVNTPE